MDRIRINRFLPVFLILIVLLMGCDKLIGNKHVNEISEFYEFGDSGLTPGRHYVFCSYDSLSSETKFTDCDLLLEVRYSELSKIKNLPVSLEFSSLHSDSIISKEIKVPLFDNNDNISGKGNFGIYESIIPVFHNINMQDSIIVALSTNETTTEGIISVGIIYKSLK